MAGEVGKREVGLGKTGGVGRTGCDAGKRIGEIFYIFLLQIFLLKISFLQIFLLQIFFLQYPILRYSSFKYQALE